MLNWECKSRILLNPWAVWSSQGQGYYYLGDHSIFYQPWFLTCVAFQPIASGTRSLDASNLFWGLPPWVIFICRCMILSNYSTQYSLSNSPQKNGQPSNQAAQLPRLLAAAGGFHRNSHQVGRHWWSRAPLDPRIFRLHCLGFGGITYGDIGKQWWRNWFMVFVVDKSHVFLVMPGLIGRVIWVSTIPDKL